jgi:hypothetical protein
LQNGKHNRFLKEKQVIPLQNLPANIEVLTKFGERADISPDNKQVAFMAKGFGDAMVIDVKTKTIKLSYLQYSRPLHLYASCIYRTGIILLLVPNILKIL